MERFVCPMSITFHNITPNSQKDFEAYGALRPIYTSEGQFINQYIWADFYQTKYAITDKALFFVVDILNEPATMMPFCKTEDIIPVFWEIKDYFNHTLHCPLKMYLADELFLDTLKTSPHFQKEFSVQKNRNCFDYMYDAASLKTLSGRKYHKKKNHLNSFLKRFEGRFYYKTLSIDDMEEIQTFHQTWLDNRTDIERQDCVDGEEGGLQRLLKHFAELPCKMGGVYVDDHLEAYTIGSYNPHLQCAFIHIEKANSKINGLYNYVNQQFLLHEFPDAQLVNREDDLGQEGLRKAKLSYHPLRLEEKHDLIQIY